MASGPRCEEDYRASGIGPALLLSMTGCLLGFIVAGLASFSSSLFIGGFVGFLLGWRLRYEIESLEEPTEISEAIGSRPETHIESHDGRDERATTFVSAILFLLSGAIVGCFLSGHFALAGAVYADLVVFGGVGFWLRARPTVQRLRSRVTAMTGKRVRAAIDLDGGTRPSGFAAQSARRHANAGDPDDQSEGDLPVTKLSPGI